MRVNIDLPDIQETIATAVETAIADRQTKLFGWKFYTLKETAELLQIRTTTLLDKRQPYLLELEYSQSGKLFWFTKTSVERFIESRMIRRYKR